jgi:hypothetical protein
MTPLWWMIGASLLSWLIVTTAAPTPVNPEALIGMLGPLTSAAATWVVTKRAHTASPERVMGVMVTALAVKMVLFGVYVTVVLGLLDMRPFPFVVSFTSYFIALYAIEAWFFRRLFSDITPASSPV